MADIKQDTHLIGQGVSFTFNFQNPRLTHGVRTHWYKNGIENANDCAVQSVFPASGSFPGTIFPIRTRKVKALSGGRGIAIERYGFRQGSASADCERRIINASAAHRSVQWYSAAEFSGALQNSFYNPTHNPEALANDPGGIIHKETHFWSLAIPFRTLVMPAELNVIGGVPPNRVNSAEYTMLGSAFPPYTLVYRGNSWEAFFNEDDDVVYDGEVLFMYRPDGWWEMGKLVSPITTSTVTLTHIAYLMFEPGDLPDFTLVWPEDCD